MLSQFERYRIQRLREGGMPVGEIACCLRLDRTTVREALGEGTDMSRQYFTPSNVALVGSRREMARHVQQPVARYQEPLEDMPFGLKVLAGTIVALTFMFAMVVFMLM
jgi:IS30 family transposase